MGQKEFFELVRDDSKYIGLQVIDLLILNTKGITTAASLLELDKTHLTFPLVKAKIPELTATVRYILDRQQSREQG